MCIRDSTNIPQKRTPLNTLFPPNNSTPLSHHIPQSFTELLALDEENEAGQQSNWESFSSHFTQEFEMMKAEMEGLRGELKNLKKVVKDLKVKTTINQFLPNSQTYSTIEAFGVNCFAYET